MQLAAVAAASTAVFAVLVPLWAWCSKLSRDRNCRQRFCCISRKKAGPCLDCIVQQKLAS
eukprot:15446767-Alexandrium_andersonii.AAC.1